MPNIRIFRYYILRGGVLLIYAFFAYLSGAYCNFYHYALGDIFAKVFAYVIYLSIFAT